MMTATFLRARLIVCVLNALPTASLLNLPSIACRGAGAGHSHYARRHGSAWGPRLAVPTLYEELAVDVARPSNGTHGWTAVAVSYVGTEDIGTVIDRGLAAHGIDTRDALVSVRLDEEVLSEAHYCAAVGDRRLEILFTKDSAVHRAVAEGGVLQSQVNTLEAKVEALQADIVNLKADTDAKIEALESNNSELGVDIVNLKADIVNMKANKRVSIVQNILKDFGDLFRLRYTKTTLAKDLEELAGERNDAVHFVRVGQKSVQNFSALHTYDLSPEMLKKESTYDNRALLSAKVWIVCEFLKQGLPEVRVSTSPPSMPPPPSSTTTLHPTHTTRANRLTRNRLTRHTSQRAGYPRELRWRNRRVRLRRVGGLRESGTSMRCATFSWLQISMKAKSLTH